MPKELSPISVEVTPVRRIKGVKIDTVWDESVNPPVTRVQVFFEYELVYPGTSIPPQPDGQCWLSDEQARQLQAFPATYAAISQVGQDLADSRA